MVDVPRPAASQSGPGERRRASGRQLRRHDCPWAIAQRRCIGGRGRRCPGSGGSSGGERGCCGITPPVLSLASRSPPLKLPAGEVDTVGGRKVVPGMGSNGGWSVKEKKRQSFMSYTFVMRLHYVYARKTRPGHALRAATTRFFRVLCSEALFTETEEGVSTSGKKSPMQRVGRFPIDAGPTHTLMHA